MGTQQTTFPGLASSIAYEKLSEVEEKVAIVEL
jgi:hypothetical protein